MSVWFGDVSDVDFASMRGGTLIENLGIEVTEVRDDALVGRMPVDARTVQPAGVLHGGASVALAETLASWAGHLAVDRERFHAVGQEINANHIRPVSSGWVTATATPAAIGRRSHVWEIRIADDAGRLVCISRCTLAIIEQRSTYAPPEDRSVG
ncbi:hotdog fold thioesterase [Microbacterium hominis]|uniref:Hotdog fold thioesterase n=1 Tax=Microbacterium hominis TaxID=162426 RepID=A0A7D4UCG2_9MICO|nr:hotdog fold thioesterase [Microbacterium hominis]QKJ20703.1 hotdog fold thioesterase [Microbacterium hominis]